MKKKLMAVAIFATTMLLFVGCGKEHDTDSSYTASKVVAEVTATATPTVIENTPTPTFTPTPTETPTPTPTIDPLAIYRVSEEYVQQHSLGIYLKRGDNYYDFCHMDLSRAKEYNVGGRKIGNDKQRVFLCEPLSAGTFDGCQLLGDLPIVKVQEGDTFIAVGATSRVLCSSVEFVGYSTRIEKNLFSGVLHIHPGVGSDTYDLIQMNYDCSLSKIGSSEPIPEEDWYHLEPGKTYVLSWYEGVNYCERQMVADCKVYKETSKSISIDAELQKSWYGVIDVSSFEPGLYWLGNGVIEIP